MSLLLARPGWIGPLHPKNRIIMAPMGSNYGTGDGISTERDKLYYAERARGGVAMIVTESMVISARARNHSNSTGVFHDSFIPGLAGLVNAIHANGALAVAQIGHRGGLLKRSVYSMEPVGPSPWVNPNTGDPVRELSVDEILGIQDDILNAAKRLRRAGYDAVEIHAANGYLFHQFFSRRINKRTDAYGGSLENRMRLLLETVTRLRRELPDLPLIVRISATEYMEGGYTGEEIIALAQALEGAGIAALDISGGSNESPVLSRYCIPPASFPRRLLEPYAAPIKQAVTIPVLIAGRIVEPADAEAILAAGSADFIVLGRPLRADPYWVRKALGEITTPIRQCIYCNNCFERLTTERDVTCVQNPLVGTEFESLEFSEPQAARSIHGDELPLPSHRKRVLVLGAGVAGAEAARVLAARGHEVEVWEKADKLGGQSRMAVVPPHKEEVRSVWDYRWKQLVDMKVPVRTGVDVTVEAIQAFSPDLVVVATGGTPTVPAALKGGEVRTITAWELLSQPETVASGSVVTVVGGGLVGLETADLLAGKGCRVTVLEMMPTVAPELPRNNRTDLLLRLDGYGVKILTEARVERVEGRSLIATVKGESMVIEVGEALIVALGVKPNRAVVPIIEAAGVPYVLVGDSNQPGNFRTAIRDGLLTALSVDMEGDD